jgi:hypothetical protein
MREQAAIPEQGPGGLLAVLGLTAATLALVPAQDWTEPGPSLGPGAPAWPRSPSQAGSLSPANWRLAYHPPPTSGLNFPVCTAGK